MKEGCDVSSWREATCLASGGPVNGWFWCVERLSQSSDVLDLFQKGILFEVEKGSKVYFRKILVWVIKPYVSCFRGYTPYPCLKIADMWFVGYVANGI